MWKRSNKLLNNNWKTRTANTGYVLRGVWGSGKTSEYKNHQLDLQGGLYRSCELVYKTVSIPYYITGPKKKKRITSVSSGVSVCSVPVFLCVAPKTKFVQIRLNIYRKK